MKRKNRVTIDEAIRRLKAAGLFKWAKYLEGWRNKKDKKGGWDGHIRGIAPHLVPIIWPPKRKRRVAVLV